MDIRTYMQAVGRPAREASRAIAAASRGQEQGLHHHCRRNPSARDLLAANASDLEQARADGLEPAMIDRLTLSPPASRPWPRASEQIAALPDPVGEMTDIKRRPSGIQVGKMRVPLGVIGIIYEARPNVTADAAALCLKSATRRSCRGGKEGPALQPGDRRLRACQAGGRRPAGRLRCRSSRPPTAPRWAN